MMAMNEFRSALFIPGGNEKMLNKASSIDADLIIFDLEDSVLEAEKPNARRLVQQVLQDEALAQRSLAVRINAMDTPHLQEDLAVVMAGQPDIILLPKLENGEQLLQLSALLDSLEAKNNIPANSTKVIAITGETPTGVLGFDSIDNPCDRLVGLSWGPEDLATELGATANRDTEGKFLPPFELLRTLCLLKAKELGVQAIDTVFTGIGNSEGLVAECIAAHSIGYTGKLAIHPSQIELINQAFSPTEEELIRAKKIVDLFAANPNAGALQLDNKMVDIPHLKQAQRLLARSDNSS